MSSWVVAAVAALALALVMYGWREREGLARRAPLVALRALALGLVIALLLDAPAGAARPVAPFVALDVSASWRRGHDTVAWRTAVRQARAAPHDSLYLFGDSARIGDIPEQPADRASRARPAIERALAAGRPLTIVTDGEIDDPGELPALPAGSRIEVVARAPSADLAVIALDAPRAVVGGDTVEVRATVRAAAQAPTNAQLTFALNGRTLVTLPLQALPPLAERTVSARVQLASPDGPHVFAAVLSGDDAEPGNDTLATVIDIARAARAVLVSTRPDLDARFMTTVLRGAISLPTRAYFRVTPDEWRLEGPLTPIGEEEVRRAVRDAPLLVLHGDTAHFGAPRGAASGALALVPNVRDTVGEWYPVAAPASPVSSALSGIPWDSLPPLVVGSSAPRADWEGLVVARARQFDRRPVISGSERPRRVVTVTAAGFWRWRFRGGRGADAYDALWGSIFDWLAAQRTDARAAVPADAIVREGDDVRWLRGSRGDSTVRVILRRRGDSASVDSVTLRFGANSTMAETAALSAGVYDVAVAGGPAVLVVNRGRELLPRTPTVQSGEVGEGPVTGERPRLRDRGWPILLALLALCAEWLLRRRSGLR
ncbi:MAG TPA: hypothetical protein VJ650_18030 [Gemmatimonadaceae bacterium]|nr:hypothetical protein [Gemmatimonadaceae bacterium]